MARRRVGASLITLDTSALFALLNRSDPDHERVREAFADDGGPYLLPGGILAEIAYLVERRLGGCVLDAFLRDLEDGALSYDCGDGDFARVRELTHRYDDLPLGTADACVVACAERNRGRVLTLDRDLSIVAREGTISILPAAA